jgi:hypothetical protein
VTKRHYFTSFCIFLAALFYVKTVLELHWWEALGLVMLAIVCVVHSIDVVRDIERRKMGKRRYTGPDRRKQEPPSGS